MPLETQYFIVVLAMFALACLVLALCAMPYLLKGDSSSSSVSASAATMLTREEESEPDIAGRVLKRYARE
jgi:hypothetical protein